MGYAFTYLVIIKMIKKNYKKFNLSTTDFKFSGYFISEEEKPEYKNLIKEPYFLFFDKKFSPEPVIIMWSKLVWVKEDIE